MTSGWSLLLALAAIIDSTAAVSHAALSVNIATIVSAPTQDQANVAGAFDGDQLDFILVGNSSIPSTWLNNIADFTTADDSKVLFQASGWSLIEDGRHKDSFLSSWARFQALDASVMSMSVCTIVAEWDSSWKEDKAMLSAVEVNRLLTDKCAVNDTIALAFTSAVSKTVASYLEGETAVNNTVASFKMLDVHTSAYPEASNRLFVRVADGICPQNESDKGLPASNEHEAPVMSLFMGKVCVSNNSPNQSQAPNASQQANNYSHPQRNFRYSVPIIGCILLVGCATMMYVVDKRKLVKQAPKVERDDDTEPTTVYTLSA